MMTIPKDNTAKNLAFAAEMLSILSAEGRWAESTYAVKPLHAGNPSDGATVAPQKGSK